MAAVQLLLREYGYAGLMIILFLDGSGIPWPTEATLVFAGAVARSGHLSWPFAFAAALTGGVLGSALSYYLGWRLGHGFLQRLFTVARLPLSYLDKGDHWFETHGEKAVFFGRFIPFVRVLVGYPAGIIGMNFGKYLLFSTAGYAGYAALTLSLGYVGMSVAELVGDMGLVIWLFGIIGLLVFWFKWGRTWVKQWRGRG